jgi:tetratricopeptide (TPR) repeat protein
MRNSKVKRLSDIPPIAKEMQSIYGAFLDSGGDFENTLCLLDDFLEKYPHYTEALVLKARALIAVGRRGDALKCLKMAKRIDKWNQNGRFDEAELYLERTNTDKSYETFVQAVKSYATDLKDGIDNFLLCCNSGNRNKIEAMTRKVLSQFFEKETDIKIFDQLQARLVKIKNRKEPRHRITRRCS